MTASQTYYNVSVQDVSHYAIGTFSAESKGEQPSSDGSVKEIPERKMRIWVE